MKRRKDAVEGIDSEEDPLAQDVVPFSVLKRSFKNDSSPEWRSIEDRALELALSYLQQQRQVAVEISNGRNRSEKLIKFKQAHEAEPPRMTETDRQIIEYKLFCFRVFFMTMSISPFRVKRATTNLEQELSNLDQQVAKLDREARAHVRAGNKAKAKTCLRQKLLLLKRMKEKETAYDNLSGIMNQLAQTKEHRSVSRSVFWVRSCLGRRLLGWRPYSAGWFLTLANGGMRYED